MEDLLRSDTQAEFTIERLLGQGGMGIVYEVFDTVLDRRIALKATRQLPDPMLK